MYINYEFDIVIFKLQLVFNWWCFNILILIGELKYFRKILQRAKRSDMSSLYSCILLMCSFFFSNICVFVFVCLCLCVPKQIVLALSICVVLVSMCGWSDMCELAQSDRRDRPTGHSTGFVRSLGRSEINKLSSLSTKFAKLGHENSISITAVSGDIFLN